ncbi:Outer membrane protein W (plasmid) [Pseudoseohaeicola sp. NH-UV-7]|uniref:OmpW/AlkL family protein n=1 Tax=unclassified Sulfitobacter TaxID=196795 RepID=UPI000E0C14D9|nr:OmpW family outer membrane protein [Sulfitobacter sp. JL08]AXI55365.1 hypothetical protein C1J05_13390 [Sulfitobacter sp. JL08]
MKNTIVPVALAALIACSGSMVAAQSQGDWSFGIGLANVNPKSGNGTAAGGELSIDDDTQLSLTAEYFIRDNLGIELLAATPFEHTISIAGLGTVGSTNHLPPTLSLQYHFPTNSKFTPFIGAGVNYTNFFDEETTGAIAGGNLTLKNSWGLALHAGVDFQINDNSAVRLDARYINIESDVYLNGAKIGKAEIDPVVLGISYVFSF